MTDLLEAVDDLTLPRNVKVPTDDGHTWATEDALLVQLREAVSSSLNSGSGSGGSPWARSILNSAALHQAGIITSQIGDWCRIAGAKVTRESVVDLRAWYVAHMARPDHADDHYMAELHKWAGQIRAMVNPPKTVEITAPCPVCNQGEYTNDMGELVKNPLVLTYRPEGGSIWQDAKALCRACQQVWDTEWRLRELRHDIDALDTA